MSKQGSYNVNENASKDSSFKSFICALLVFLSLCIAIYLMLVLIKRSPAKDEYSEFKESAEQSESSKLINGINAPVEEKEKDYTTHGPMTTTEVSKETTQRDTSTKLTVRVLSTTEYANVDLGIDHSIFHDTSSTENIKNVVEDDRKYMNIYQSTPNSVGTKEDFVNDTQASNDLTTEINIYQSTPNSIEIKEDFVNDSQVSNNMATEIFQISEITETTNARQTTKSFRSTVNSIRKTSAESTIEHFYLTTESSKMMSQLNEAETSGRYWDKFKLSTDNNLLETSTVSVSDTENFDVIISSADTGSSRRKESITMENSTHLSTIEVSKEDKEITKSFMNTFHSSTQNNLFGSPTVSVSDTINYKSTTISAETIIPGTKKSETVSNYVPLSTTQSYVHTTGKIEVNSLKDMIKVCDTAICNRTTSKMLSLMNHAADPCVDFYEFACGEQQSDNNYFKQLNFEALLNYITEVDKKYIQDFNFFYESCVDHERNFKFTERTKLMEYLPSNNLTELFVELILTQSMPLFDIGLDIAQDNPHYILQITLPGRSSLRAGVNGWSVMEQIKKDCLYEQSHLTLHSEINLNEMYTVFRDCQKHRFKNSTTDFVDNMQPYSKHHKYNIYNDVNLNKLLDLLDEVQKLLPSELEIQEAQIKKKYKLFKVEDLYNVYNVVDWKVILENIMFNSKPVENIEVYFPNYIEDMLNKLNKYNEGELMEILGLYSKFQLYENSVIPKVKENRKMYCMELSKQMMPDVVSIIVYEIVRNVDKFHNQNQKIKMLFDGLKSQFNVSLEKSTLDSPFKKVLQEKLYQIELGLITTVDYNSTIDNYKEITMSANNFQENVLCLLKNYRKIIYSLQGKKTSVGSLLTYFVDPFCTRPKSFYLSKYIVFHPTIFQRTSMELPHYIILSKIGLHLGQELAKHFDPIGVQYNMNTQLDFYGYYDYLTKQTNDMLLFLANNTYELGGKSLNFQIHNNNLWTTKMIADNTAFRLVVDLFNLLKNQENLPWIYNSYPTEKVFFISAAQEYCEEISALNFMEDVYQTGRLPPPLRIQNMVGNSMKFSEIFECADGSAMKLSEDMITQFPYVNSLDDYSYSGIGNN